MLGDGADGLLDGDAGVEARRAVDVDVVDAQAREAVGEEVLDRRGPRVEAEPRSVGAAQGAELHREQHLVAPAAQGPADQHLVVAHAVEVAGVDEVDAGSIAAWMVAMLSASSAGPYMPHMPMQPRAMGKTAGPVAAKFARLNSGCSDHGGDLSRAGMVSRLDAVAASDGESESRRSSRAHVFEITGFSTREVDRVTGHHILREFQAPAKIEVNMLRRIRGTLSSILWFNRKPFSAILDCAHQVRPNPTIE